MLGLEKLAKSKVSRRLVPGLTREVKKVRPMLMERKDRILGIGHCQSVPVMCAESVKQVVSGSSGCSYPLSGSGWSRRVLRARSTARIFSVAACSGRKFSAKPITKLKNTLRRSFVSQSLVTPALQPGSFS